MPQYFSKEYSMNKLNSKLLNCKLQRKKVTYYQKINTL